MAFGFVRPTWTRKELFLRHISLRGDKSDFKRLRLQISYLRSPFKGVSAADVCAQNHPGIYLGIRYRYR